MRIYILIAMSLIMASCQEDYILNQQAVIGRTYSNLNYDVDIISEDSLIWSVSFNRDSVVDYKLPYVLQDNRILFSIADTLIKYYTDPFTDRVSFMEKYLSDSFNGTFYDDETLVGDTINHSYAEYVEGKYIGSFGSTTIRGTELTSK